MGTPIAGWFTMEKTIRILGTPHLALVTVECLLLI